MDKSITIDFDGVQNYYSVILDSLSFIKEAGNLSKEVSDFIAKYDFDKEKYVYVLINALGAEEPYGPNKNGDAFPEYFEGKKSLIADGKKFGYKTFEEHGKLYKHHANKDPKKSYGDVLLSIYCPVMKRVELVVRVSKSKAPYECSKIERGEIVSTSMGTKVPYDVCSICGNKAKKRADYCYHLKNMMGTVLPDGRLVYAINPFPKFFDISMVFIPADVTSRVLKKIASLNIVAEQKEADIVKDVPAQSIESTSIDDIIDQLIRRKVKKLERFEPEFPKEHLQSMCKMPLRNILSTLAFSGIMPKPKEFQRIVLIKIGKEKLADILEEQNLVFNQHEYDLDSDVRGAIKIASEYIDENVYSIIEDMVPVRSRWQPFLYERLAREDKIAFATDEQTADNLVPIMLAVSGLYSLFKEAVPHAVLSALAGALGTHPIWAVGAGAAAVAMETAGAVLRPRVVSMGTQNAEELLKLSNVNDYLDRLLIKNVGNDLKKVAGSKVNTLKWLAGKVFKNYGGFLPKSSTSISDALRRGAISLPLLAYSSGSAQVKRSKGRKTNIADDFLMNHPGKAVVLTALLGHKVPKFFKGASENLKLDEDTIKLLYNDGDLLDIMTLVKLGEI